MNTICARLAKITAVHQMDMMEKMDQVKLQCVIIIIPEMDTNMFQIMKNEVKR